MVYYQYFQRQQRTSTTTHIGALWLVSQQDWTNMARLQKVPGHTVLEQSREVEPAQDLEMLPYGAAAERGLFHEGLSEHVFPVKN